MKKQHKIIFVIVLAVSMIAFSVWSMRNVMLNNASKIKRRPSRQVEVAVHADPILVRRLQEALNIFMPSQPQYTFIGTITVTDYADSTASLRPASFIIARKADDFYMKQNGVEVLSSGGIYINIDSSHRKVFVSKPQVLRIPIFFDVQDLEKAFSSEGYQLTSHLKGVQQTLTLLNERHIGCKEYRITFDTLQKKVNSIYSRIADAADPLNSKKQKTIYIELIKCDKGSDMEKYPIPSDVITRNGKLTQYYKDYELIVY